MTTENMIGAMVLTGMIVFLIIGLVIILPLYLHLDGKIDKYRREIEKTQWDMKREMMSLQYGIKRVEESKDR